MLYRGVQRGQHLYLLWQQNYLYSHKIGNRRNNSVLVVVLKADTVVHVESCRERTWLCYYLDTREVHKYSLFWTSDSRAVSVFSYNF